MAVMGGVGVRCVGACWAAGVSVRATCCAKHAVRNEAHAFLACTDVASIVILIGGEKMTFTEKVADGHTNASTIVPVDQRTAMYIHTMHRMQYNVARTRIVGAAIDAHLRREGHSAVEHEHGLLLVLGVLVGLVVLGLGCAEQHQRIGKHHDREALRRVGDRHALELLHAQDAATGRDELELGLHCATSNSQ